MDSKTPTARDVDEYLAAVPKESRAVLEKLRQTIKAAAPKAVEVISYKIPIYKYEGMLAGFAAFKDHCSLFVGPGVIEAHQDELKRFGLSKGTIRFPADKPISATLVKKLIRTRIKQNEARAIRKTTARKRKGTVAKQARSI